jgi:pimeloyl-ACP methyl ester carboxylesterase
MRECGEGSRTIVLVPDPPNTIELYDDLIELLRRHTRVVCFEAPGFGLSYPSKAFGFSATEYAEVVSELVEGLQLGAVSLVMSCMGGYIGLLVARARPDLVDRLYLCQTPSLLQMQIWVDRFDHLRLLSTPIVGQAIMWTLKGWATRSWYPAALPLGVDATLFVEAAMAAQRLGGPYALASGIQALRSMNACDLVDVAQPATVIWGHADRTHAKTDPGSLRGLVPHARLVSFEHCGHFPDLEDPRRFASLLLEDVA